MARIPLVMLLAVTIAFGACERVKEDAAAVQPSSAPVRGVDLQMPPLVARLQEADKELRARRVRLLGLTDPAKDYPFVRIVGAGVEVHTERFGSVLREHHEKLVVVEGMLVWVPIRKVPMVDDRGMAVQSRGYSGGWTLSDVTEVRPPRIEELAGQVVWVLGTVGRDADGPTLTSAGGEKVRLVGEASAIESGVGTKARVLGLVSADTHGASIRVQDRLAPDLHDRVDQLVSVDGRCWSMNEEWWFESAGERFEVSGPSGVWPPRHLAGGGHGSLATMKGRLRAGPKGGRARHAIEASEVLPLADEDVLRAGW